MRRPSTPWVTRGHHGWERQKITQVTIDSHGGERRIQDAAAGGDGKREGWVGGG